jgi:hypothetical protein
MPQQAKINYIYVNICVWHDRQESWCQSYDDGDNDMYMYIHIDIYKYKYMF